MLWTGELDARHSGSLLRLLSLLDQGNEFCFIIAEYNHRSYQQHVIQQLKTHYPQQAVINADDSPELETTLQQHAAADHFPLHIIATLEGFQDAAIHQINQRREWIAKEINRGIILWLYPQQLSDFAHHAPDMWAWRKAMLDFCHYSKDQPTEKIYQTRIDEDNTDLATKTQRLQTISDYLGSKRDFSLADASLLLEQARIFKGIGKYEEAIKAAKQCLAVNRQYHAKREEAIAYGELADIHVEQGEIDEALRICYEKQLPVYENLGDQRSKAVTMGRIADILQTRGEFEQALKIRYEELAVYERLASSHDLLMTQVDLAQLLKKIDLSKHRSEIESLLNSALSRAIAMQIPEVNIIKERLAEI
jgi:tetratricopeptide (TPR) repeat protein